MKGKPKAKPVRKEEPKASPRHEAQQEVLAGTKTDWVEIKGRKTKVVLHA